MEDESDQRLIRAYACNHCEEAFAELVHRHVDLVYSTALRVLRNANLAEDITQRVFLAVAQHSKKLQERYSITGWLYETTRNFAVSTIRSEERRRHREQEAAAMKNLETNDPNNPWQKLEPSLDDALAKLSAGERELILWRYFERCTAEQMGVRLGLTAEAAQKRAARALERLRGILAEEGLATPAGGLAALLPAGAIQSAPAGLAASTTITATSATSAMISATALQIFMTSTKAKIVIAAVLAVTVSTPLVIQHQTNRRLNAELDRLKQQGSELDRLRQQVQQLSAEAESSTQQREKDRSELARLRGELAALKSREPKTPLVSKEPASTAKIAGTPSQPLVREEDFGNIGFQTPSSTVQTLEWAKARRDTNVIASALAWADEHSRAQIEALFAAAGEAVRAKYGTADAYVLSLFNFETPPDDRRRLTAYRILDEKISGEQAMLMLEFQFANGETHTGPMRYVRIGESWRQALDFDEPSRSKLNTSLQAEADTLNQADSAK